MRPPNLRGLPLAHDSGRPERPAIVIVSAAGGAAEREVAAGIEEEGVPYVVHRDEIDVSAIDLARSAALRSPLGVGVGVDARGEVWVHHAKLAEPLVELGSGGVADTDVARMLGHHAARMVVGLPLKPDNRSRE
ncbi:glycerol dehydratase reactivase beta/small subunit family protein [Mycolicibacterium mageritense]